MTLTGIIFLLLIGVVLILVEIFLIPGIGAVGVLGALMMLVGVYLAYQIEVIYGHIAFLSSVVFLGCSGMLAFRAKTWDRFSLKSELTGKVNLIDEQINENFLTTFYSRIITIDYFLIKRCSFN